MSIKNNFVYYLRSATMFLSKNIQLIEIRSSFTRVKMNRMKKDTELNR